LVADCENLQFTPDEVYSHAALIVQAVNEHSALNAVAVQMEAWLDHSNSRPSVAKNNLPRLDLRSARGGSVKASVPVSSRADF
jgi:hypothetical protein